MTALTPPEENYRAVTLWQPWATLIALGVKTIETRGSGTRWRGPLLIHAAKREPELGLRVGNWTVTRGADGWFMRPGPAAELGFVPLPLGAVVAVATLVDVWPMVRYSGAKNGGLVLTHGGRLVLHDGDAKFDYLDAQLPYGDFRLGRCGWMLDSVHPLTEPVSAKGLQAAPWTPAHDLVAEVVAAATQWEAATVVRIPVGGDDGS